jgi:hypothetical protein
MAALDIPIVPVNSDAKTFAAMSLTQAINNMHLAQAGGGTQTAAADKQQTQKKDLADRQAMTDSSRERGLFDNYAPEEQSLPRDSAGAPLGESPYGNPLPAAPELPAEAGY